MSPSHTQDRQDVQDLRDELDAVDEPIRTKLARAGFDAARLLHLAAALTDEAGDARERRDRRNRVAGAVRAPSSDEVREIPPPGSAEYRRFEALGMAALEKGELALAVLAGGMATRMGGVVKALVEVGEGYTFLDLRLRENRAWPPRVGKEVPLWLMTSDATDGPTRRALEDAGAPEHVQTFTQDLGLRLTPDGHLFREADGHASLYSPGHGDLVDALRRSGLLRDFAARGGRHVWIANLDNLGATIDPCLLGMFIDAHADLMAEVTDKEDSDRGGIPVHARGKLQILEEFRLPRDFDATTVRVFNTNTLLVSAHALETVDVEWNWFEVEKNVDGRPAIQFERLLQELTGALTATYVRVPRSPGTASRFLPVKDHKELEARKNTILDVARSRGILEGREGT